MVIILCNRTVGVSNYNILKLKDLKTIRLLFSYMDTVLQYTVVVPYLSSSCCNVLYFWLVVMAPFFKNISRPNYRHTDTYQSMFDRFLAFSENVGFGASCVN